MVNRMLFILFFIILATGIILLISFNARSDMYKWKRLADVKYDVKTMVFASRTLGWRAEELPWDFNSNNKSNSNRYRLLTTTDGGTTWNIIYETNLDILKLRYNPEMKCLWSIMFRYPPNKKRELYKSKDGGYNWELVCPLSFSAQGMYFFDDQNGYAWTENSIHGTYNAGKTWHLIANTKFTTIEYYGEMQIIGENRFIFFIEDQKVFGLNFWEGQKINLPLPIDFDPEDVIVKKSETTVYVLGKISNRWTLLTFENNQLMLTESVPVKEKKFHLSSFAYGDNVINIVGTTTGAFFNTSYFYRRDSEGWHKESISGSNNYSHFAYWGDYMWAQRVSLRRGTRELLFREVVQ